MNTRKKFAVLAAALFGLAAFAAPASGTLELRLEAGKNYSHKHLFGPIPVRLTPQIAIWLEKEDGSFVDTIYVTRRSAKGDWKAAKGTRRPEALPVWSHARGIEAADGLYMPDAASSPADAVTGATPSASFARTWKLPAGLEAGIYRIRVELNESYDWNEAYPDKLPVGDPRRTEANGQPSILWEARLQLGANAASARLAPAGTGSLDGSSGEVKAGLEGITSARDIVASITATYRP
jgi:hypothetical protein